MKQLILISIPIEPLEERYSTQWYKWFHSAFRADPDLTYEVALPFGMTSGKINTGSFLDVVETNIYKSSQTNEIIRLMVQHAKPGKEVVLFFHDLWHPGLSNIAYVRDGLGLTNVKICGCLHAGSYDPYDFLNKRGMTPWARWLEESWFGIIADKIFVATEFHKDLLCCTRLKVPEEKVVVTGFPIYPDFIPPIGHLKEDIVVFPHRLDSEKQPKLFDELQLLLMEDLPTWKFVKSKEATSTKKEYYDLLRRSKIAVSFALQETWGIAMQEAVLCYCIPLVPDRLSYTEMYPEEFVYKDLEDLAYKVTLHAMDPPYMLLENLRKALIRKGEEAIPNIISEIKKLAHGQDV